MTESSPHLLYWLFSPHFQILSYHIFPCFLDWLCELDTRNVLICSVISHFDGLKILSSLKTFVAEEVFSLVAVYFMQQGLKFNECSTQMTWFCKYSDLIYHTERTEGQTNTSMYLILRAYTPAVFQKIHSCRLHNCWLDLIRLFTFWETHKMLMKMI